MDDKQLLKQIKTQIIDKMDPVDWTLSESYVKTALNESLAGVSLLISLLLPTTYDFHTTSVSKSLSRNANVIFTPVEKLNSYPISSQPMQLLLQSQLKGM